MPQISIILIFKQLYMVKFYITIPLANIIYFTN